MHKSLLFLFLLITSFAATAACKANTLLSPDGRLHFTITLISGKLYYQVTCDSKPILNKSSFSFNFKGQPSLGHGLSVLKTENYHQDETWVPVACTSSHIRNNYNEQVITLTESKVPNRTILFIARAYNDGIAFRYQFPGSASDSLLIAAENTEFNFPANDSAWWIPSNEFAYESIYRHSPLTSIPDANTPLTIETRFGFFLSIHEAALQDYSEMILKRTNEHKPCFVSALWPEPDGVCARVSTPFKTPWRCIIIARKPAGLIESHLVENLNEPCAVKDVSWIKPLKFVGIWWGMHIGQYTWAEGEKHGATTARTKQYIDFAASHHIEGVLAEGWNKGWETWASGMKPVQDFTRAASDFDLVEVTSYARKKNVAFISHHETGGNIPEYERQMDSAFDQCRRLGIHYLKTGYAGTIIPAGYHHHGQYMVRHFQKVVETAVRYHISLDVHESIKPTGLSRTWPNLLTQEAARGNEWNATYTATPPSHEATLPFTRFLAGPYDYTPGIFHIIHSPEKNKRLYCTLTNQLALFVVFHSPMMMASDMVENYEHNDAFQYIENVPSSWDETKVINAKIGHYVTIARRSEGKWFVGTVGDE